MPEGQASVTHLTCNSKTPHSTHSSKEDAQPGYHGNGAAFVTAREEGQRLAQRVPLPVPAPGLLSESFVVLVSPLG